MILEKPKLFKDDVSGFTLLELAVTIFIIGILASISIPVFSTLIPDYKLRSAAQEIYSDMYLAKMKAIKMRNKYKIVFLTGVNASYIIKQDSGPIEKTVTLSSPDSGGKICFGCGKATKNATKSGGVPPPDGVSYYTNSVTFNPRGMGSSGYAYIENSKGTSYAIGTLSSGVIFFKKWNNSSNSWE